MWSPQGGFQFCPTRPPGLPLSTMVILSLLLVQHLKGTVLHFSKKKWSLWCCRSLKQQSDTKIYFKELRKSHFVLHFSSKIYVFAPQKSWSNADYAPRDHRALVLCPAKLWSNADFAPHIVSGAKKNIIIFYCRLFFLIIFVNNCHFRYHYNTLNHFLGKKIFCVTIPFKGLLMKKLCSDGRWALFRQV